MYYDVMVFDVSKTPDSKEGLLKWYREILEMYNGLFNKDEDACTDPDVCSNPLKNWFQDMIEIFPPLWGSNSPDDESVDSQTLTSYIITENCILAECGDQVPSGLFAETALEIAARYGVIFFDSNFAEDGGVFMPDGSMLYSTPLQELEAKTDKWHNEHEHQKIVDAVLAFPQRDVGLLMSLAIAYNNTKQYQKAVDTLLSIKDETDDITHWYYVLAYAYHYLEDYAKAIEAFEQSLKINPKHEIFMSTLAQSYYKSGKKEKGVEQMKKVIRLRLEDIQKYGDSSGEYGYLAIIDCLTDDDGEDKPDEMCDEELLTILADAYYQVACWKLKTHKIKDAKKSIENAIKLKPDNAEYNDILKLCNNRAN